MCVYLVRCGVALRGNYLYVCLYLFFLRLAFGRGEGRLWSFFFSLFIRLFFFSPEFVLWGGGEVCIVGEWSEACVCDGREGGREDEVEVEVRKSTT